MHHGKGLRNGPLPIFFRTLLKRPLQPTKFISTNTFEFNTHIPQYFEFFLLFESVECQSLQLIHLRETDSKTSSSSLPELKNEPVVRFPVNPSPVLCYKRCQSCPKTPSTLGDKSWAIKKTPHFSLPILAPRPHPTLTKCIHHWSSSSCSYWAFTSTLFIPPLAR